MFVEQLSRSHVNLPFIKHRNSCAWICYLWESALTPGCYFVFSSCHTLQFCLFPVRLFHGLKYPVFQKPFINNLFPNLHFAYLWIQHHIFCDSLSACTLQGLWDLPNHNLSQRPTFISLHPCSFQFISIVMVMGAPKWISEGVTPDLCYDLSLPNSVKYFCIWIKPHILQTHSWNQMNYPDGSRNVCVLVA